MSRSHTFRNIVIVLLAAILTTGIAVLANVASNAILRGSVINFFSAFTGILVAAAGALLGAVVAFVFYYQSSKAARKQEDFARDVQHQTEEVRSLSIQSLEFARERSGLEKQKQVLLWQMSAAELMKDDPRLAIVTAYQGLESEIQNLVSRAYQTETSEDSDKQEFSVSYDFDMLAAHTSPDLAREIMEMRDLRTRIVHGKVNPEEVTEDKAREYVQNAIWLAQQISQKEQTPEE